MPFNYMGGNIRSAGYSKAGESLCLGLRCYVRTFLAFGLVEASGLPVHSKKFH